MVYLLSYMFRYNVHHYARQQGITAGSVKYTVVVIVISKPLKRHTKAKRRATAYSPALRQIRVIVQRIVRGRLRSGPVRSDLILNVLVVIDAAPHRSACVFIH